MQPIKMKNSFKLCMIFLMLTGPAFTQLPADSIIRFSDLQFHTELERKSARNFIKNKKDTFNLFMAIDESVSNEEINSAINNFKGAFKDLEEKKIQSMKMNKKIKFCYSSIHDRFLTKYTNAEFFPAIFKNGNYNCVTASMLYAMVFDKVGIPYKVMVASDHVYLIANPGESSVVIETTNPGFEKTIFSGEFKDQYVSYLRSSKLISESDLKSKSTEEIFEEKFNAVRPAAFNNLPGFQYYNKAITKIKNNELEEGLRLCQKAYYFFPDQQVKVLLYNALLMYITKSDFDKVADIDYLAQFARFENVDINVVTGIFNKVLHNFLQYTDKEQYCDSLYNRLISKIQDNKLKDELIFTYNLQMSYRYQNQENVEKYIVKALQVKGNHSNANMILTSYLQRKLLNYFNEPERMLDTIRSLESRMKFESITPLLMEHKLMAYLNTANNYFNDKKFAKGDECLKLFENECNTPIKSMVLNNLIERTYRTPALHFYYKGNKAEAKRYVDRGLKFVPRSKLLESVVNHQ